MHEEKNLLEKVMNKFNYNIFDEKIIKFYDIQDELENIKDFLNRKYNSKAVLKEIFINM